MSKHTPGPWSHNPGGYTVKAPHAQLSYQLVATLTTGLKTSHEVQANASLIAAAPELLDALRSVWLWMEDQADGQSKGGHATFDLMLLREQRDIVRAAIDKAEGLA